MATRNPYASVQSNEHWTESEEVKSSISIKTRTGYSGSDILDMVRSGKNLPDEFLENRNIASVVILSEVTYTLTRKEEKET